MRLLEREREVGGGGGGGVGLTEVDGMQTVLQGNKENKR